MPVRPLKSPAAVPSVRAQHRGATTCGSGGPFERPCVPRNIPKGGNFSRLIADAARLIAQAVASRACDWVQARHDARIVGALTCPKRRYSASVSHGETMKRRAP